MALLRKALMFAITSGLAKKAWNSYRQKNPVAAARAKSDLKDAGRQLRQGDRERPWSK
jgi:hypothetical protein